MHRDQAFAVFSRLASHFPTLAGEANDPYAEARTTDWVDFLCRYDTDVVEETFALLVKNWTKDRYPRIGDFQEIARTIAARPDSRQLARATANEATYQCPGGCRDTGLVEYTTGLFDVGTEGRQTYHEASEDRPVMARCPVCNGGTPPRRIHQDATTVTNPARVPRAVGLAGVGAAKAVLDTLEGYKTSGVLPPRRSSGNAGPPAPMLTYEQVYDEHGQPRPELAGEVERITRQAVERIPEEPPGPDDPKPLAASLARAVASMEHGTLPA